MLKRILLSGALGFLVLALWTFVTNGFFGFTASLEMNRIANERQVYEVLKANLVAPGVYLVNPALTDEGRFPDGEPVFSIRYSGFGHEAAGRMLFVEMAITLLASVLMAGLLSVTSDRILSRFSRRVVFIAVVGLLLAVFGDLTKSGIGGYPAQSAMLLAAYHFVSWALAGLVMAWAMRAPAATASAK